MQNSPSPSFPVVSMGKFTLLYFCTMGFYSLYWFYRNWAAVEAITGRSVFKLGRTVFAMFYVHQLFSLVKSEQKTEEQQHYWRPIYLAWFYIGAGAAQYLLTLLVDQFGLSSWFRLLIFCMALLLHFYVLYTVQLVMNRVSGDPFGVTNSRLTIQNLLWITFGFYLWFSTLYSFYLQGTAEPPLKESSVSQVSISDRNVYG